MRAKNFFVQTSDAVPAFVDHLKNEGEDAFLFNLLTDQFKEDYTMVFANAVMPHFSEDETMIALRKVHNALNAGGIFAFSVKQGQGEEWITEKFDARRYVKYWQSDEIYSLVREVGFKLVFKEEGIIGDLPNHIWINISAQKL